MPITTIANGATGLAVRNALNANFNDIARRLQPGASPIYTMFDGDSKGQEILEGLKWAAFRYALDLRFDGGNLNVGGSSSGSGTNNLINATRMATAVAALAAHTSAGHIVDYYMTIGTNDISGGATTPATVLANVRKFHEQVLRPAACVRFLILMSVDPRSLGNISYAAQIHTLNRLYQEYARANPYDVIYVDTTPWLLDPSASNTSAYPIPYTSTAAPAPLGAVTYDGLHCSNYGWYRKQFAIEQVARALYRPKTPRDLSIGIAPVATYGTGGNMLGANGRCVAAAGTNSVTNNGSGSVTGLPPTGSTLSGTIDGTASLAFATSTVTVAIDGGILPKGSWPAVRLTLSGTTGSATNSLQFQMTGNPLPAPISTGDVATAGCLLNLNALVGLMGINVHTNNDTRIGNIQLGSSVAGATSPLAQAISDAITTPLLITGDDIVAPSNTGNSFFYQPTFYFPPNTALSGSIDFIDLFVERVGPIPAATP
jgi:lysophospholipase L1-like esterase